MQDIKGKVAFVTGGASGIGLGMAHAFVAAGMKVAIADIEQAALDHVKDEFEGSGADVIYLSVGDGDCLRAIGKCVKLGNRTRAARVDVLSIKDGITKLAATASVLTTVNLRR